MSRLQYLTVSLFLVAVLPACGSDDPTQVIGPGAPPVLPELATMNADLSFFPDAGGSALVGEAGGHTTVNFGQAAFRVAVIEAVTVLVMAVPVATFASAAQNQPVYDASDDKFHWRYSVQNGGNTFAADLAGSLSGGASLWEMRISATGTNPPLDEFLWYTGTAEVGSGSGSWTIFDAGQPSTSTQVLGIDWEYNSDTDRTLTFTVLNASVPENGDTLTFQVLNASRSITFFDQSEGTTAVIQWDAVTGAGSITVPGFNGGEQACWDMSQEDVACTV